MQSASSPPNTWPHRDLAVNTVMAVLAVGVGLSSNQNVVYGRHGHSLALRVADVVLGVVCIAGIWLWRRRRPVAFAVASIVVGTVSTLAGGVAVVAVFTVAEHRRWPAAVGVSVLSALSIAPTLLLYPVPHDGRTLAIGVLGTFAVTGWGMFVRARRLLLGSLRTQLEQAEQAASARAEAARRGERERIAREMHDVLAHRLSLLAVHAGALEFHPDASPDEVERAAGVIRSNSREALDDLRSVINVLRDGDAADEPSRPQPTLADLPGLIEESRAVGLAVACPALADVIDVAGDVPPSAGRTVYRVVQEALTNVRKHAPFARVRIDLDARPGEGIDVHVRNPVGLGRSGASLPGSGTGLIGLRERVTLAGGRIDYGTIDDGQFEVRAWVPWSSAEPART